MARHGENIRKRADGRWEGRYPTYSEVKKQQVYRSVYGRSYKEVKDKLAIQKDCLKRATKKKQSYRPVFISTYDRNSYNP